METIASSEELVKEILCDVLEIELDELTERGSFEEDYDADSLRAVEILAALEKALSIKIPQNKLESMTNFENVKSVLKQCGWQA